MAKYSTRQAHFRGFVMKEFILTVILVAIAMIGVFQYFGSSQDKNDVLEVRAKLATTLNGLAGEVNHGDNVTIDHPTVVGSLKTPWTNRVFVVSSNQNVTTLFDPGTPQDLSGHIYTGDVANIAQDLANGNNYLVIESKASMGGYYGAILSENGPTGLFRGDNSNADEAGLTYRNIYIMFSTGDESTVNAMDKLVENNPGILEYVSNGTFTVKYGITETPVILIKMRGF